MTSTIVTPYGMKMRKTGGYKGRQKNVDQGPSGKTTGCGNLAKTNLFYFVNSTVKLDFLKILCLTKLLDGIERNIFITDNSFTVEHRGNKV